ncbi:hypothetical protein LTS10_012354 [Elasticomyces elasticus]|nr:hypothetical protein LTS10_012354 [Elasticomyces elasticus]
MAFTLASRTTWSCIWSLLAKGLQSPLHRARATCSAPWIPIASRRYLRVTALPPRFETIEPEQLMEEERVPGYEAHWYYPVNLFQVFNDRYLTVAKLGYGTSSTVWLCRDTHSRSDETVYVTLKVYTNCAKSPRELPIYEHINGLHSTHAGMGVVRRMLAHFNVAGPHGYHVCLVHEPCGMDLHDLKAWGLPLDAPLLRVLLRSAINGLEFLHEEARVVHTDLHPGNILMGIHEERNAGVLSEMERVETVTPAPRKILPGRTIYASVRMSLTHGVPLISDLGEARRVGDIVSQDLVMPGPMRAPEVILGMPWSYPVDVWSVALTAWYLWEPHGLFRIEDEEGKYSDEHHLAHMVALLGPPPLDFLERSEYCWKYWNRDGTWKGAVPIPVDCTLESTEERLEGDEKQLFLTWIRKMLQWKPEDRADWNGVYFDHWLCADLLESGEMVDE